MLSCCPAHPASPSRQSTPRSGLVCFKKWGGAVWWATHLVSPSSFPPQSRRICTANPACQLENSLPTRVRLPCTTPRNPLLLIHDPHKAPLPSFFFSFTLIQGSQPLAALGLPPQLVRTLRGLGSETESRSNPLPRTSYRREGGPGPAGILDSLKTRVSLSPPCAPPRARIESGPLMA